MIARLIIIGSVPDPWIYLAERHPEVKVRLLPSESLGRRWGQTVWTDGVPEIHLAVDLGKIQRRCTLAHELHHVLRGAPCRPLCPDNEADVQEDTARFLLPTLDPVADALTRHDLEGAAESLNVTRNVLTDRLDTLIEDELVLFGVTLLERSPSRPAFGAAACTHVETGGPRRSRRVRTHDCGQEIRRRLPH